jgi:hypothetical protein
MKSVVTVWEAIMGINLAYLPIRAGKSLFIDAYNRPPLILLKMQEQKSLMLC